MYSRQREQQVQRPGGAQAPARVLVLGRLAWPARKNWREMSLDGQAGKVVNECHATASGSGG